MKAEILIAIIFGLVPWPFVASHYELSITWEVIGLVVWMNGLLLILALTLKGLASILITKERSDA